MAALSAAIQWLSEVTRRRKPMPPQAGIREPRRPRPTLPAAAIALDEPRTEVRLRLRLLRDQGIRRRQA